MSVTTYRTKSMHEALSLIRRDLGPDAAVLHTREVNQGVFGWLTGNRCFEVTASAEVAVPSRFTEKTAATVVPPAHEQSFRQKFRDDLKIDVPDLHSVVEEMCAAPKQGVEGLPESLFQLFAALIEVDVSEDMARQLVESVRDDPLCREIDDVEALKTRIAQQIEEDIRVSGPIRVTPGQCRLVALIGPTGVGKTTTIAKLAANYRLREKRRVGLITVDTYRIASVEQLRTYADIIDLPMEVVTTPREMREARSRLADMDLILMDTAGRSPHDDVRIQELKSMLTEARADEVHLVLSSVTSASGLTKLVKRFSVVGPTSMVLTKLDETTALGNILPILKSGALPLSYVTNGQDVPDDIEAANRHRLARMVLSME
jgi:flagellar biosynthesis protein FlhF